jgi:FkbM family methyltransferase
VLKKNNRFIAIIKRLLTDVELIGKSVVFAIANRHPHNRFVHLYKFRKALAVGHISPFHRFAAKGQANKIVSLRLKQFGDVLLHFDLADPFQMAICEEFVLHQIYNLQLLSFVPDYSIDCGTYRGYFSFLVADKFVACDLICVEPHPDNYAAFTQSAKQNGLKNIRIHHKALSATAGSIMLELWGSNMAKNEEEGVSKVAVETISLYELLKDIPAGKKLLLKVDIEGSELDFFPACITQLPAVCAVFLETHDGWQSLHTIKQQFIEAGFSFSVLRDRGLYIDSFAQRNG